MKREQLVELLRSGNFTIASHGRGQVSIYKGKHKGYTSENEMPEFPEKEEACFYLSDNNGYMQYIVPLLTEALGGSNGGSA